MTFEGRKTVGVTGAAGFLGWHSSVRLQAEGFRVLQGTRDTFKNEELLDQFVTESSTIVHAAGVNRAGTEDEITEGNRWLAQSLVDSMKRTGTVRPIVYANSIFSEGDSVYGQAKRAAADILRQYCESTDTPFTDLVLPHLFGEYGRPFYNSAAITFAHQLAIGEESMVKRDAALELLHVQDVAQRVVHFAHDPRFETDRIAGRVISVGETYDLLSLQHGRYVTEGTIPAFADMFEQRVFNMLRSSLHSSGHYPQPVTLHSDERGTFAELVRSDGLGQTSISTTAPGVTRGDHFHFDKIERFIVISGQATIRLRRLLTKNVETYSVIGDSPVIIDMPPLVTHNITNNGTEVMTTLFWAGDHFDPAHPDTYVEPVEQQT